MSVLRRRILSLAATPTEWLPDYALSRVHKFEDRFRRHRTEEVRSYQQELFSALHAATDLSREFFDETQHEFEMLRNVIDPYLLQPSTADLQLSRSLYSITRLLKPRLVVETGVWHGLSSYVILAAMDRMGQGRLISIDFPPLDSANQVEVGNAVPEQLRTRWQLHVGPSRRLLPNILREKAPISIFVHDSSHFFRNMLNEYRQAWRALDLGGLLISDDVNLNDAFLDFSARVGVTPVIAGRNKGGCFGILVKPNRSGFAVNRAGRPH